MIFLIIFFILEWLIELMVRKEKGKPRNLEKSIARNKEQKENKISSFL